MQPSFQEYLYATGALAPDDDALARIKRQYLPGDGTSPIAQSYNGDRRDADTSLVTNVGGFMDTSHLTNILSSTRSIRDSQFRSGAALPVVEAIAPGTIHQQQMFAHQQNSASSPMYLGEAGGSKTSVAQLPLSGSFQYGGAVSSSSAFNNHAHSNSMDHTTTSAAMLNAKHSAAGSAAPSHEHPHDPILDKTRSFLQQQEELQQTRDRFVEQELGRLGAAIEAEKSRSMQLEQEVADAVRAKQAAEEALREKELERKSGVHGKYLAWKQQEKDAGVAERIGKEKAELEKEHTRLEAEFTRTSGELQRLQREKQDKERAFEEKYQQMERDYRERLSQAEHDLEVARSRLSRELHRLSDENALAESKIAHEAELQKREGQRKIGSLEERVKELQGQLTKAAEGYASDTHRVRDLLADERRLNATQRSEHQEHVDALQKAHALELEELKLNVASTVAERVDKYELEYLKTEEKNRIELNALQHRCTAAEKELEDARKKFLANEEVLSAKTDEIAGLKSEMEDFRLSNKKLVGVREELAVKQQELDSAREKLEKSRQEQLELKRRYLDEMDALREFANKHARGLREEAEKLKAEKNELARSFQAEKDKLVEKFSRESQRHETRYSAKASEVEQAGLERCEAVILKYEKEIAERETVYEDRLRDVADKHSGALSLLEDRVRTASAQAERKAELDKNAREAEFETERHSLEKKIAELQGQLARSVEAWDKSRTRLEERLLEEVTSAKEREDALDKEIGKLKEETVRGIVVAAELERLKEDKKELLDKVIRKDADIAALEEKVQTALNVYESKLRSANQQKDFECNSLQASLQASFDEKLRSTGTRLTRTAEEKAELEAALEVLARQHHELVNEKRQLLAYVQKMQQQFGQEALEVHRDLTELRKDFRGGRVVVSGSEVE